jgi:intracellular sulfur oxidation DsrE/DsrF family protein
MKKRLLLFIAFTISVQIQAQKKATVADFGKVFQIEKPDLLLQKNKTYKVVFDVYTDGKKKSKKNSSIVTVARFINMHVQQGVPISNLKVALVLHGSATKNALNDTSYLEKYGKENPNSELLSALKQANVDIFVCGQSLYSKGYKKENISKDVQLSLSALTALVHYQSNGYQLINFN